MSSLENLDLCWQVEAACAHAWPTLETKTVNGYEFRHSAGAITRRNNSLNPTAQHGKFDIDLLAQAGVFYDERKKPLIVRIPAMVSTIEPVLDAAGFGPAEALTKTLLASDLSSFEWRGDVQLSTHTTPEWLEFAANRAQWTPAGRANFLKALQHISYPILFAHIEEDQELAAIAYAIVVENIAIIESVETAPKFRRQGRAAKLLSSLLAKCRSLGATKAALQVVAQNTAARALYQKLGFTTQLYDYHYRSKPLE